MKEIEQEIVKILLNDDKVRKQSQPIYYWCDTVMDLSIVPYQKIVFLNKKKEGAFLMSIKSAEEIGDLIQKTLLYFRSEGKIYSDVEFEINPDRSYTSRYWFDEARLYKEEYDSAMLTAKDFPHAEANSLVNHQLAYKQKFKRKFERIVLTYWIENELPHFELYSINKKNQKLPIELDDEYIKNTNDILKKHYEVTNNGILKDVWKPWNKIILSIPPNGYLNENEDIEYYLDDVKLEKDFFLRGY
jgi:hypothetical protein